MSLSGTTPSLSFGPFELHPERRQLLEQGEPVRLGSRALDLLIALTERAGELLSRSELEARLWPSTVVEETSLRVHVSALRKALGESERGARYIANVPGRGYSFVAPLERRATAQAQAALPAPETEAGPRLPGRISRVIGREEAIVMLSAEVRSSRLVSLVAAGGMGKTTVALEVARRGLAQYPDGVRFVDLSPLSRGGSVLSALSSALVLGIDARDSWAEMERHLRGRRMLLVLDNCEHVIQSAAELAEKLLLAAPQVHILATSREALNVPDERVHHLAAFHLPAEIGTLGIEDAKALPAIQLFVERASANAPAFELDERNLPHVHRICHRLDGLPLAIELAAARVDTLGAEGLAARLDQMFDLLTRGRRTALPRHRTLQALLDWSHELLTPTEQAVLRRLSLFRSFFSLASATRLCCDSQIDEAAVIDAVLSLIAQSLIAIDRTGDAVQYRLLYTTRSYAGRKLTAAGERDIWSRRHAELLRELLEAMNGSNSSRWADEYMHLIEDLHSALDWTLTPEGDTALGVMLVTTTMAPVHWIGCNANFREAMDALLAKVRQAATPQPELELRLQLRASLGVVLPPWDIGQSGRGRHRQIADRAVELLKETGTVGDQIEVQYGLFVGAFGGGDYPSADAHAQRIVELAVGAYENLSVELADRLMALNLHYLGDHSKSRRLVQRVLEHRSAEPIDVRFRTLVPYAMSMGQVLTRISWLEGDTAEANRICDEIEAASLTAAPVAACQTVGLGALPIALWRGDLAAARRLLDLLADRSARSSSSHWMSWARTYERVLQVRHSGEAGQAADGYWPESDFELDMLVTLVPEWVSPRALERVEKGIVGWNGPETLRAWGQKLMNGGDLLAAEPYFLRAGQMAEQQGALAWQLRVAISLAGLRKAQGRADEGRLLLEGVLARFPEGSDSSDLRSATLRLDALKSA